MTNGTSCFGFSPFVGWGLCPSPLTLVGGASASTTAYGEREAAVLLKCGLCTPMWFSQDACTLSSTESGVMGTPGGTLAKLIANSTEPPQPPAQAAFGGTAALDKVQLRWHEGPHGPKSWPARSPGEVAKGGSNVHTAAEMHMYHQMDAQPGAQEGSALTRGESRALGRLLEHPAPRCLLKDPRNRG